MVYTKYLVLLCVKNMSSVSMKDRNLKNKLAEEKTSFKDDL